MEGIEIFLLRTPIFKVKRVKRMISKSEAIDIAPDSELATALVGGVLKVWRYPQTINLTSLPADLLGILCSFNRNKSFLKQLTGDSPADWRVYFQVAEDQEVFSVFIRTCKMKMELVATITDNSGLVATFAKEVQVRKHTALTPLAWKHKQLLGYSYPKHNHFELWTLDFKQIGTQIPGKSPFKSWIYEAKSTSFPRLTLNMAQTKVAYLTQRPVPEAAFAPCMLHVITMKPGHEFSVPVTLNPASEGCGRRQIYYPGLEDPVLLWPPHKNRLLMLDSIRKSGTICVHVDLIKLSFCDRKYSILRRFETKIKTRLWNQPRLRMFQANRMTAYMVDMIVEVDRIICRQRFFLSVFKDRFHRLTVDNQPHQIVGFIVWGNLHFYDPNSSPGLWTKHVDDGPNRTVALCRISYMPN